MARCIAPAALNAASTPAPASAADAPTAPYTQRTPDPFAVCAVNALRPRTSRAVPGSPVRSMHCPRPTGVSASREGTPVTSGVVMGLRFSTVGGSRIISEPAPEETSRSAPPGASPPSRGWPRAPTRRPTTASEGRRNEDFSMTDTASPGETEAAPAPRPGAPLPLGSPPREYMSANVFGSRCARRMPVAPFAPSLRRVPGLTSPATPVRMARWPSRLCTCAGARVASTSAVASASIWSSAVASTMACAATPRRARWGLGVGTEVGRAAATRGRRATAGIPPAHAAGTGRCAAARETANAEEDAWRADRRAAAERSDAGLIAEAAPATM